MNLKQFTIVCRFTIVCFGCLPMVASAAKVERSIKIGYAPSSSSEISGRHLNLYNPRDPSTYRIENTRAEGGKINDTYSLGYFVKRSKESSPWGFVWGVSLNQGKVDSQDIRLVSQEGLFEVTSSQPRAEMRYLDLYFGGEYAFSGGNNGPYVGAGLSLVKGKAYRSFYSLNDLLTGGGLYGQSGSSSMDGHAFSIKAGMKYAKFAIELEQSRYDLHIDSFRSFDINGADIEFDRTMLSLVWPL